MNIIVDAFGGDNAPLEIIKGAACARAQTDAGITLVGDADGIRRAADSAGVSLNGLNIVHAGAPIPMDADPAAAVRERRDSPLVVGMNMLRSGEGDAIVSAGNTGALLVGGTLIVKRIKGVARPALASMIPCKGGSYMLLDCGASAECKPHYLMQYGLMGSLYMELLRGVDSPRVGLVNVGGEQGKGSPVHQEGYELLKSSGLNFTGNTEGRDLPLGGVDVAVADGFTGNVTLKLIEGMGRFFAGVLRDMLTKNPMTKLSALALRGGINDFKDMMDYRREGGAPLLGLSKPVIKAHGSSDALAVKNAIKQACFFARAGVTERLELALAAAGQAGE